MGMARWDPKAWSSYSSSSIKGRSRSAIFSRRGIDPDFDPRYVDVRESRDSKLNPQSNAIAVAFDVTGSMGMIPEAFVRHGLRTLVEQIIERQPVPDPHVMIMGFGDAWCDEAPLQVSQFEADIRIAEQLTNIWLEGGGGGNDCESYNLPWYFAARHTSIDCLEKRGRKGYLFTVGDEPPAPVLLKEHVERFLGDSLQDDIDTRDLLTMVSRMYHVFHIMVAEGHCFRFSGDEVTARWRDLLGQNAILLTDHNKLAEVIVSTIAVTEGAKADAVARSWSGKTAAVVADAVRDLTIPSQGEAGVIRL